MSVPVENVSLSLQNNLQKTLGQSVLDASPRVLVLGDVMLDRYWYAEPLGLLSTAPVPRVERLQIIDRPGGAANVAVNLCAWFDDVTLVAPHGTEDQGGLVVQGPDEPAAVLEQLLHAQGVRWVGLPARNAKTITKLRLQSQGQQMLRVDFETPYPPIALNSSIQALILDHNVVVFSDYAKGALGQIESLLAYARQHGRKTFADPKGRGFERYRGTFLLKPNFQEFTAVVGAVITEAQLYEKAQALCCDLALDYLLITRGAEGMVLFQPQGAPWIMPSMAKQVYDVTGAGDTVLAAVAAGFALDQPVEMILEQAAIAAACVVGEVGTSRVKREQVEMNTPMNPGLVSPAGYRVARQIDYQEALSYLQDPALREIWAQELAIYTVPFEIMDAARLRILTALKAKARFLWVCIAQESSFLQIPAERALICAAFKIVDTVVSIPQGYDAAVLERIRQEQAAHASVVYSNE